MLYPITAPLYSPKIAQNLPFPAKSKFQTNIFLWMFPINEILGACYSNSRAFLIIIQHPITMAWACVLNEMKIFSLILMISASKMGHPTII